MRRSPLFIVVLAAVAGLTLPITANAAPVHGTRTLDPVQLWTSYNRNHAWDTSACRWALGKLNDRSIPEPGTALVGYDNAYDESSGPSRLGHYPTRGAAERRVGDLGKGAWTPLQR